MRLKLYSCGLVILCLMAFPVLAQETKSAELLYRSGDRLYLANVTTGTTTALPEIKTTNSDRWLWSPDGRYLLGSQLIPGDGKYRIRVYDVENQNWLENIVFEAAGYYAAWSSDSTKVAYSKAITVNGHNRGHLRIFNLITGEDRLLYQTEDRTHGFEDDTLIADIWWAPNNQKILFISWYPIMGGSINRLYMISVLGGKPSPFSSNYYAEFRPIWSPDAQWMLLNKLNKYFPVENADQGDIYLYNLDNQRQYQLTNTPDIDEQNIHWSSDGKQIQFEANGDLISIELQAVIDHPQTFEQKVSILPSKHKKFSESQFPSPDGQFVAFLIFEMTGSGLYVAQSDGSQVTQITAIKDAYQFNFLGWRPS